VTTLKKHRIRALPRNHPIALHQKIDEYQLAGQLKILSGHGVGEEIG
jgi:hypothetical protein